MIEGLSLPVVTGSDGVDYVPKEVDMTLQNSDTWFYQEGRGCVPTEPVTRNLLHGER